MLSKLNHEGFSCIIYIFLNLYYTIFEGSESFVKDYVKSLPLSTELKKACKKIVKNKEKLLKIQKNTLKIMDLVEFIFDYYSSNLFKLIINLLYSFQSHFLTLFYPYPSIMLFFNRKNQERKGN